jgi:Uma2 family endonuclease
MMSGFGNSMLASLGHQRYVTTMSLAAATHRLTEAEYLACERTADFKSEFFDGETFAMAGGSPMHSLIAANLIHALRSKLPGKPCRPFTSDLRLKVEATGLYTYADVPVVCGELQYAGGEDDTIVNPAVLIEVLSDSTEAYDRGKKFEHYRLIPTLREYLLVSQKEPRIEQFVRQEDGHWLLHEAAGMAAALPLPSLGVTIALAEVFAGVEFTPAPMRAATPPRH